MLSDTFFVDTIIVTPKLCSTLEQVCPEPGKSDATASLSSLTNAELEVLLQVEGLWPLASVLAANKVSAAMLSKLDEHDQQLLDQWCQGAGTSCMRARLMQVADVCACLGSLFVLERFAWVCD